MTSTYVRGAWHIGNIVRETGQAMERLGARVMGQFYCAEPLDRHRQIMAVLHKKPMISPEVYLAPCAELTGFVHVGSRSSVWYGTVIRGCDAPVLIGEETNIQDGAAIHSKDLAREYKNSPVPTVIGDRVTIGHKAIVCNSTLEDECLIGMGSIIGVGSTVSKHSMIAAGSALAMGSFVPSGELWAGAPAVFKRKLTAEEIDDIKNRASHYSQLAASHMEDVGKTPEQKRAEGEYEQLLKSKNEFTDIVREHRPDLKV